MIAESVYLLCSATSFACTWMLFRAYRRNRVSFLLWCTLCFLFLTFNNIGLFLDLVVMVGSDYSVARTLPALIGLGALAYGLIWEVR